MACNELKRLMNYTFVTWSKVCTHPQIPRGDWRPDGKYNVIRFKNGSTIDLLDTRQSGRNRENNQSQSTSTS
jgi:hypothetical protein